MTSVHPVLSLAIKFLLVCSVNLSAGRRAFGPRFVSPFPPGNLFILLHCFRFPTVITVSRFPTRVYHSFLLAWSSTGRTLSGAVGSWSLARLLCSLLRSVSLEAFSVCIYIKLTRCKRSNEFVREFPIDIYPAHALGETKFHPNRLDRQHTVIRHIRRRSHHWTSIRQVRKQATYVARDALLRGILHWYSILDEILALPDRTGFYLWHRYFFTASHFHRI